MVQSIGFPVIMRTLGVFNFIYGPILLYVTIRHNMNVSAECELFENIHKIEIIFVEYYDQTAGLAASGDKSINI